MTTLISHFTQKRETAMVMKHQKISLPETKCHHPKDEFIKHKEPNKSFLIFSLQPPLGQLTRQDPWLEDN
jgi:hypothetical protein